MATSLTSLSGSTRCAHHYSVRSSVRTTDGLQADLFYWWMWRTACLRPCDLTIICLFFSVTLVLFKPELSVTSCPSASFSTLSPRVSDKSGGETGGTRQTLSAVPRHVSWKHQPAFRLGNLTGCCHEKKHKSPPPKKWNEQSDRLSWVNRQLDVFMPC